MGIPPARPPALPTSAFELPSFTPQKDAFIAFHWLSTDMTWQTLTTLFNHEFDTAYPDWISLHGSLFYRYCRLRRLGALPDTVNLGSPLHVDRSSSIMYTFTSNGNANGNGNGNFTSRRKRLLGSPPKLHGHASSPSLDGLSGDDIPVSPSSSSSSESSTAATISHTADDAPVSPVKTSTLHATPTSGPRYGRALPTPPISLQFPWLDPMHFVAFWRTRGMRRPYRWLDRNGREVFVDDSVEILEQGRNGNRAGIGDALGDLEGQFESESDEVSSDGDEAASALRLCHGTRLVDVAKICSGGFWEEHAELDKIVNNGGELSG
ncbi:MAG: hypothetical protein M1814_004819 [Vezdaea aestivalis]|nr:MAG: hypothetical protein M1814_004819 [Vezdaea aestivalis]